MRKTLLRIAATTFVTALAFAAIPAAHAGDPGDAGVVRISDRPTETIQQVSHATSSATGSYSHGYHPHRKILFRPSASCGYADCGGFSHHSHHGIVASHIHAGRGPLRNMLTPDKSCTYSPAHGWARPVPHPVVRYPVEYRRYWPAKWYGEPGGGISPKARRYPTIYMPTDTTQLGFYYQVVPRWRPNPAMIPPAPWPPHWHSRECPAGGPQQVTIGRVNGETYYDPPPEAAAPVYEENALPPAPEEGEQSASALLEPYPH